MTDAAAIEADGDDAARALSIFLLDPARFGGLLLRGDGPVRDAILADIRARLGTDVPLVRIPASVDMERLLGGVDLAATLASGRRSARPGLLATAAGGVIIVSMAERIAPGVAAHVAQAVDRDGTAIILLDDGVDADEVPPAILTERAAFHIGLSSRRDVVEMPPDPALALADVGLPGEASLRALAATATAFGVGSARALNAALQAACGHAALAGRTIVDEEDIAAAVRLVLAPRATRLPEAAPPPPADQPECHDKTEPETRDGDDERRTLNDDELQDMLLEAAAASIPPHILDRLAGQRRGPSVARAGRAGDRQRSARRGRPKGSRAGTPGHGQRLALIDTLRAAAPWQAQRRSAASHDSSRTVHVRKSDLRIRKFEQQRESLTIFAVDASGSAALTRLAEAKGAVELLLAQSYVKRAQVALVAFRQASADVLLPPTRSLTRARRALGALPGGGGTPLAAGLIAAQQLAEAGSKRGQTPTIAILTDGKANVARDGSANREAAMADAAEAARHIAQAAIASIVIDIAPRPRAEAAALADALRARYLPLPQAHSAAMVAAIETLHSP